MLKKALFFLSLIFSTTQWSKDNSFTLCINQWDTSKIMAVDNLPVIKDQLVQQSIITTELQTASGIKVPVTFYDRKSDILIVAAQGLPMPKEFMNVFTKIFPDCDLVTFDYRWCNHYGSFLAKSILMGKPVQRVLLDEIEELKTVVDSVLKRKSYKSVVGMGECYSCFHLAKLQSDMVKKHGTGPFTHLILDSCWYSIAQFIEQICYDPFLPFSPRFGGAPRLITGVTNNQLFKKMVVAGVFTIINDVSIEPYISTVDIPVLFIHGRKDLFVPQNYFKKIWQATSNDKRAALLTPFQHVNNLKNKKIYQYITDSFIQAESMREFESSLWI